MNVLPCRYLAVIVAELYKEMADNDPKSVQDLTTFVQQTLQDMQGKFQSMSENIVNRIDDMGGRIDDLEKNIAELLSQAGVDENELSQVE
ncbi:unnamed protein product [Clavelina lepadiformis]|uniref:Heat shock factor-binding protein 1 n=1 Tax=Clavelina lepadiformis TaxID=159417 RepID=A0ABP0FEX7_CLALP